MKLYSIMPLNVDHIYDICDDIERQYKDGIATEALFNLPIPPEGNPIIDKAGIGAEKFVKFRDELNRRGLNAGILVQATIGHGYPMTTKIPFTPIIGFDDGLEKYTACPYDENFRDYLRKSFKTLASTNPSSIMVDDDFRLFARSYHGCTCHLHMEEISRRFGKKITREELCERAEIDNEENRKLYQIFYDTQIDSLLGAAKAMREGIDSVDPTLQASFCNCGDTCEGAGEIAKILAGKGNPVILRVNNGKYCTPGARGIADSIARAAVQKTVLAKDVDIFLAETDTCPQNRYSTSAASLHTHFICSILEGAAGAKHWITRLAAFEPKSGEAYRKKLSKNRGMYAELSRIVPEIEWFGARIPLSHKAWIPHPPLSSFKYASDENAFASCVLERLGIPMYFSDKDGGAVFLDGKRDQFFNDEEIKKMLAGTVFLASDSAQSLINRGFGEYLGVNIRDVNDSDPKASGEIIHATGQNTKSQLERKILTAASADTVEKSYVYTCPDGKTRVPLHLGVSSYKNSLGGTANVFCGTPLARFVYFEAFSFLNESRKAQIVEMMRESGNLPIYYPDDAEVYMKSGYLGDKIFCAFVNIGLDNLDEVTLVCEKPVTKISKINSDGSYSECDFSVDENGKITVNTTAPILEPALLVIE